jgi:hypothetical protein
MCQFELQLIAARLPEFMCAWAEYGFDRWVSVTCGGAV